MIFDRFNCFLGVWLNFGVKPPTEKPRFRGNCTESTPYYGSNRKKALFRIRSVLSGILALGTQPMKMNKGVAI